VRKGSAGQLFAVGLLLVLAVAGVTFGVVQALGLDDDDPEASGGVTVGTDGETPATEPELVLAADQIEVTGTATGITVEGATVPIPSPLVVTGGRGELRDVEVDGQITDVVWDGGRPFDLQGAGALLPQELNLFAAPNLITAGFVDDVVSELEPGAYGLATPVAIGRSGVAEARDSLAFEATVESTAVFHGGATTSFLPRELSLEDGGRVLLEGHFRVRRPDGTTVDATAVELPDGAFRLSATPLGDASGYDVRVLLQGAVNVV
jgi:hypothetical protein